MIHSYDLEKTATRDEAMNDSMIALVAISNNERKKKSELKALTNYYIEEHSQFSSHM